MSWQPLLPDFAKANEVNFPPRLVFALPEANELSHMDLSGGPARFKFADALTLRDWHIHHSLAMALSYKSTRLLCQRTDRYEA